MASDDDMVEGSISSLLVDSLKSHQNGDDLSPEDITWADSCLIEDPDISDGDWSSVKAALIEIIGLQHDSVASHNSAAPTTDGFFEGTDIEMLQSAKPAGIVKFSRRTNDDTVSVQINNEEMETVNDEFPVEEEAEYSVSQYFLGDASKTLLGNAFLPNYRDVQINNEEMETAKDEFPVEEEEEAEYSLSQHFRGDVSETSLTNAFLPNYKEGIQEVAETMSSENVTISSLTYEIEPWTQEIFKVWDLGIQPEEDELFKQLNKALTDSSDQLVTPSTTDDSRAYKDLKEQSVDDLITGLADLSLNRHFN